MSRNHIPVCLKTQLNSPFSAKHALRQAPFDKLRVNRTGNIFYKKRKKKLARFKKIKKFIFISDKHLRIVDKKLLVIFLQNRASSYVVRRDIVCQLKHK